MIDITDVTYYLILIFVALVYLFAFKTDIISVFDPLVMLLINLISSGALVLSLQVSGMIKYQYTIAYVICSLCFIVGYKIANLKLLSYPILLKFKRSRVSPVNGNNIGGINLSQLYIFTLLLSALNLGSLVYSFLIGALSIMSDDPALDRVAIAASNRWLSVLLSCAFVGLITSSYIAMKTKSPFRRLVCLAVAITFVGNFVTAGSKGSILSVVFIYGVLIIYLKNNRMDVPVFLNKVILLFIPLGCVYFIWMVSTVRMGDGFWLMKFISRLALSGESYYYFFVEDQYDTLKFSYSFLLYFLHTFTATVGLKLIPYNIGVAMYGGSTGNYNGFGPNPQHVVEGMVFWGIYLAPLYSLMIGYLTAYTRRMFIGAPNNFRFIGYIIFVWSSWALPIDIMMWLFNVLSALFVVVPLYLISKFISTILFNNSLSLESISV